MHYTAAIYANSMYVYQLQFTLPKVYFMVLQLTFKKIIFRCVFEKRRHLFQQSAVYFATFLLFEMQNVTRITAIDYKLSSLGILYTLTDLTVSAM